jgi:hypothetical protein
MKWIVVVGMVSALAFAASAQVDPDFQRKMDEVNRRAASRPTTGPSAAVIEARERAKAPRFITVYRVIAKPDAPKWAADWVSIMPEIRKDRVRSAYKDILDADQLLKRLKDQQEQIAGRPVAQVRRGSNFDGSAIYGDSGEDLTRKAKQLREIRQKVIDQARTVQELRRTIREVQRADNGIYAMPLRLELGRIGTIGEVRVMQVMGEGAMRVKYGDRSFILREVETTGVVDDAVISPDGFFLVSGTEQFMTVMGATATEFTVKPVDPIPHVTLVAEEMTPEWLEEELEQICGAKVPQPAK